MYFWWNRELSSTYQSNTGIKKPYMLPRQNIGSLLRAALLYCYISDYYDLMYEYYVASTVSLDAGNLSLFI